MAQLALNKKAIMNHADDTIVRAALLTANAGRYVAILDANKHKIDTFIRNAKREIEISRLPKQQTAQASTRAVMEVAVMYGSAAWVAGVFAAFLNFDSDNAVKTVLTDIMDNTATFVDDQAVSAFDQTPWGPQYRKIRDDVRVYRVASSQGNFDTAVWCKDNPTNFYACAATFALFNDDSDFFQTVGDLSQIADGHARRDSLMSNIPIDMIKLKVAASFVAYVGYGLAESVAPGSLMSGRTQQFFLVGRSVALGFPNYDVPVVSSLTGGKFLTTFAAFSWVVGLNQGIFWDDYTIAWDGMQHPKVVVQTTANIMTQALEIRATCIDGDSWQCAGSVVSAVGDGAGAGIQALTNLADFGNKNEALYVPTQASIRHLKTVYNMRHSSFAATATSLLDSASKSNVWPIAVFAKAVDVVADVAVTLTGLNHILEGAEKFHAHQNNMRKKVWQSPAVYNAATYMINQGKEICTGIKILLDKPPSPQTKAIVPQHSDDLKNPFSGALFTASQLLKSGKDKEAKKIAQGVSASITAAKHETCAKQDTVEKCFKSDAFLTNAFMDAASSMANGNSIPSNVRATFVVAARNVEEKNKRRPRIGSASNASTGTNSSTAPPPTRMNGTEFKDFQRTVTQAEKIFNDTDRSINKSYFDAYEQANKLRLIFFLFLAAFVACFWRAFVTPIIGMLSAILSKMYRLVWPTKWQQAAKQVQIQKFKEERAKKPRKYYPPFSGRVPGYD